MSQRERLREARRVKGLSQRRLASQIGVMPATIARLELDQHEPTLRVALLLAAALDTTVEALFAGDPPQNSSRAADTAGSATHEEQSHEQNAA